MSVRRSGVWQHLVEDMSRVGWLGECVKESYNKGEGTTKGGHDLGGTSAG